MPVKQRVVCLLLLFVLWGEKEPKAYSSTIYINFFSSDTLIVPGRQDSLSAEPVTDSLFIFHRDTTYTEVPPDSSAWQGWALRTNLIYAASASANLGFDFAIGRHFSLGANLGLKAWPRWWIGDWDAENPTRWRHLLVAPEFRWWPSEVFSKWFVGADLVWSHFNVGGVKFPLGTIYPAVRDNRLQGDVWALGIFAGYSWWLTKHLRLEVEAGVAAGYYAAEKFECVHCGAKVGDVSGVAVIPKLGVNLAWNFNRPSRKQSLREEINVYIDTLVRARASAPANTSANAGTKESADAGTLSNAGGSAAAAVPAGLALASIPEPVDTLVLEDPVPEKDTLPSVVRLAKAHPVLSPISSYRPYTPDRVLSKEEGALYVFFEVGKSELKRSFTEGSFFRNNGPVLDEMEEVTREMLQDSTSHIALVQIVGLASIDGRLEGNKQLSDRRSHAVRSYLQERFDLPDACFELVAGGEAWSEFRAQVEDLLAQGGGAGLSETQLKKVLDIINNEPDEERREVRIKQLEEGGLYRILKRELLRDQRNSGYLRIYYDTNNNSK